MIKHFMILSSSYSSGKRIALHYVIDEKTKQEMLTANVKKIKDACGETVSISTHYVETDSDKWDSVSDKDAFFSGVKVVDTLEEFVKLISRDRVLKGIDIAKYILSVRKCTHLELEKLVYLCYADYLCATKRQLFKDRIFAFKHGPVVESVYEEYKGTKEIEDSHDDDTHLEDYATMPARSRILFAEDGIDIISHIDLTLSRFSDLPAHKLVDITHVEGGPWDSVDKEKPYAEISDEVILENHIKEIELVG